MFTPVVAAITAAIALGLLIILQVLLAAGLPLGKFVWGGFHPAQLPPRLRVGSLLAVPVLTLAAWAILNQAGVTGSPGGASRVLCWVFTGFFTLNTAGNLASRSRHERAVMTPTTILLVACYLRVLLAG